MAAIRDWLVKVCAPYPSGGDLAREVMGVLERWGTLQVRTEVYSEYHEERRRRLGEWEKTRRGGEESVVEMNGWRRGSVRRRVEGRNRG